MQGCAENFDQNIVLHPHRVQSSTKVITSKLAAFA
jgi:hypothetical protein